MATSVTESRAAEGRTEAEPFVRAAGGAVRCAMRSLTARAIAMESALVSIAAAEATTSMESAAASESRTIAVPDWVPVCSPMNHAAATTTITGRCHR